MAFYLKLMIYFYEESDVANWQRFPEINFILKLRRCKRFVIYMLLL